MNLLYGWSIFSGEMLASGVSCNCFVRTDLVVKAELIKQPNIDGFLVTGIARGQFVLVCRALENI